MADVRKTNTNVRRYPSYYDASIDDDDLDPELASALSDGLMSKEDKIKLDSLAAGSGGYVHPDTHPASMITQDTMHRFVSDDQINDWNAKKDLGVFNANTHYDFPSIGSVDVIYKAYSERKTYQWNSEKLIYEPLNESSDLDINIINGGNANGT